MMKYNRFDVELKLVLGLDNFIANNKDLKSSSQVIDKIKEKLNQLLSEEFENDFEINRMEIRDIKNQGWLCTDDSDELDKYLEKRK